jgi:glycosyltransferase involved in cell wall biosynthesis
VKIVVITNLYPPISRGGAEKVAQRIVGELVRRGHDVVVISTMPLSPGATIPEVRETIGETVYRFFPLNVYHVLSDFRHPYWLRAIWHAVDLFSPFPARRVEAILRAEEPGVVLTHNLKGIGLRVPQAIRALGLPWIHTTHDVQLSVPSGLLIYKNKMNIFERLMRRPYEMLVRRSMGTPDMVISPSKFLADFYYQRDFFLKTTVRVMPNPAPELHHVSRGARPPGPLRLLVASQLERHKGIPELLEALNLLEIPFELHVAGDGTLAPLIRARAKNDPRIIYHGYVSLTSLEELFEIVDVLVVPSKCYENSPTVIYESLKAGVPIIASEIGGVGELIHPGENGYLVEPDNPPALAAAFRKFAAEISFFRSRDEAVRASVASCAVANYVDELEKMIKEVGQKAVRPL